MSKIKILNKGDRFGKLTIVGLDSDKSKQYSKPYYFVQCDCDSPIKSIIKATLFDK